MTSKHSMLETTSVMTSIPYLNYDIKTQHVMVEDCNAVYTDTNTAKMITLKNSMLRHNYDIL